MEPEAEAGVSPTMTDKPYITIKLCSFGKPNNCTKPDLTIFLEDDKFVQPQYHSPLLSTSCKSHKQRCKTKTNKYTLKQHRSTLYKKPKQTRRRVKTLQ